MRRLRVPVTMVTFRLGSRMRLRLVRLQYDTLGLDISKCVGSSAPSLSLPPFPLNCTRRRNRRGGMRRHASHSVERGGRSEEHTSELQSQSNLVCRLLLEKKNIVY